MMTKIKPRKSLNGDSRFFGLFNNEAGLIEFVSKFFCSALDFFLKSLRKASYLGNTSSSSP